MSLAYYGDGWLNNTSSRPFLTPRIIENGRKQAVRLVVTRYFNGARSVRDKRYFNNGGKKLMPEKQYEDSIPRQKQITKYLIRTVEKR